MISYHTRPGVVLTSICGRYYLIAARAAREFCPYCCQISESSAFLWKLIQNGADPDALLIAAEAEYEIEDPAAARQAIDSFIAQMSEYGYLVQEGEANEE